MKPVATILISILICAITAQAQPRTSPDSEQNTEYQHQYYVYNESGKKIKLFFNVTQEGKDLDIPFNEKEITVGINDTVYIGNFTSPLENVRPRSVFEVFVKKRSWIFFTKTYEAYVNVNRHKIGTDAVNYYLKVMGTKRKAEKKRRFEE